MFCALNGATDTPRRRSQAQMAVDHPALAGVRRGAADEERACLAHGFGPLAVLTAEHSCS